MSAQSHLGTSQNKPQKRGGWYSHMAMHVASRYGGWISVFLRIANAVCLNANCAMSPMFVGRIDTPTRPSVPELSYTRPGNDPWVKS